MIASSSRAASFHTVAAGAYLFPTSTRMTIATYHHWNIARRLRKDLSQIVLLHDKEVAPTKQAKPFEDQKLLIGGRQFEDGVSSVRIMEVRSHHVDSCQTGHHGLPLPHRSQLMQACIDYVPRISTQPGGTGLARGIVFKHPDWRGCSASILSAAAPNKVSTVRLLLQIMRFCPNWTGT